jgi:integrase
MWLCMDLQERLSPSPNLLKIQFSNLSRNEFSEVIKQAKLRGIDLSSYEKFYETINKFQKDFDDRNGSAENTQRNLKSAWRSFRYWCKDHGQLSDYLPASTETIESYLTYRAEFISKGTLLLDCWALSTMHKISGCPNPFEDFNVVTTKKRLVRKLVENSDGLKQAYGFNKMHLTELFSFLLNTDDLGFARTLCVASVAYETLLRESEMVRIKISHITCENGTYSLKIPYTKTNKSGEVEYCELSSAVMKAINQYLIMCNRNLNSDGFLFAGLTRMRNTAKNSKSLSVDVIDKEFHYIHELLDLKDLTPRFSSHSARVGAAQDMASEGIGTQAIMKSGRWTSELMVAKYCKKFAIKKSGMSKMEKPYMKNV